MALEAHGSKHPIALNEKKKKKQATKYPNIP